MHGSEAVGLVLARPARMLGIEPFFAELIAGLEEGLSIEGRSLLLHVVADQDAEIEAYRRWATGSMVEAVVVVNLLTADRRIEVLTELGIPAVVIGGPSDGVALSNIWVDDALAIVDAVAYLALLGHERLARVSGPRGLHHTQVRTEAFANECARRGIGATTLEGDYTEEAGRRCTRALLGRAGRPTAILYDNDIMALAGLGVAVELAMDVPREVSLLAWDDSTLCRLSNPPLTAMTLDVHAMGSQAADAVLNVLAGGPVTVYRVPQPRISARGSTSAPPTSTPPVLPDQSPALPQGRTHRNADGG
ncbi:MAG: substrate-binding domain-containing protein [Lapillicoccus sp.]